MTDELSQDEIARRVERLRSGGEVVSMPIEPARRDSADSGSIPDTSTEGRAAESPRSATYERGAHRTVAPDTESGVPHSSSTGARPSQDDGGEAEVIAASHASARARHDWDPVDLSRLASLDPPAATILRREDGFGLFYPGTRNLLVAEYESGKSWVALHACKQLLEDNQSVLYIDFESSARAIAWRLRAMGAPLSGFGYIRPSIPVDEHRLLTAVEQLNPTLVVLDGVAEAMVTHNLDENVNRDFMEFSRLLPEPLERDGRAVLMIDHLGKSSSEGGRKYPRGASAKMATVSGSALRLDVEIAFRQGHDGLARVHVIKDREGAVRKQSTIDGLVAELRIATVGESVSVTLEPPAGNSYSAAPRPSATPPHAPPRRSTREQHLPPTWEQTAF